MSDCFKREIISYELSLFENVVDACYLITMDDSTRRPQYTLQLKKYRPFHNVHIIHNKGFKNCKKDSRITNSADDLSDVYAQIFLECVHQNIHKVLIFEDDFFFTESFEDLKKYMLEIKQFIDNTPNFMTYNLGAIPYIMVPVSSQHYWYKGGMAHCVIYSQKYMIEYLGNYKTMNCLSDAFWNGYNQNYTFYKPLCFQLYPRTENSTNWNKNMFIKADYQYILSILFSADQTHEYFFPFMYTFAKVWYIIIVLILYRKMYL